MYRILVPMKQRVHYISICLGAGVLVYNEISPSDDSILSIVGLILLVFGLYLLSKGIGDNPDYDPYAVQSDEEE